MAFDLLQKSNCCVVPLVFWSPRVFAARRPRRDHVGCSNDGRYKRSNRNHHPALCLKVFQFPSQFFSGSWTWKLGCKMIKFQTYYLNSTQFWDSFVRLCVANFWYLVSCKGLRFSICLTTFMKWHSPPHLWSPIASPGGDPGQKCSRWDTPENRAGSESSKKAATKSSKWGEVHLRGEFSSILLRL